MLDLSDLPLKIGAGVGTVAVYLETAAFDANSMWERLGVASLLVIAALGMVRYFIGVVDKKDAKLIELFEKHAELLKNANAATMTQAAEQQAMRASIERLTATLQETFLQRRPPEHERRRS